MRISDWSSDVCSSDLFKRSHDLVERGRGGGDQEGRAACPRGGVLDSARNESGPRRSARPRICRKAVCRARHGRGPQRSEEHTSELQSLMRISYAVFCLKKNNTTPPSMIQTKNTNQQT